MTGELVVRGAAPDDRPAWDVFVAERPEADLLQAWAWGEANRGAGEPPTRIVAVRPDGEVVGIAQLLVRPAGFGRAVGYVPHGPLWRSEADDESEILRVLLRGVRETAREARVVVVKLDPRATADVPADRVTQRVLAHGDELSIRQARYDLQAPTTRIVDLLDGADQLWATWARDARRLTRRSEREGVEVVLDRQGDAAVLEAFADLLATTADRAGFRARRLPFLKALAEELAPRDGWLAASARWKGRTIAGVVIPHVGDRAFYLYGASLRDPAVTHAYGAYAALAAAMRALAEDRITTLDMWGVVEPNDPRADPAWEGFSFFKRQFGGTPLRHPGTFDLVVERPWWLLRDLREAVSQRLSSSVGW